MGEPIDRCSVRLHQVCGGGALLWGHPSGEASLCRPSRTPLRCNPDRRSSRTVLSRSQWSHNVGAGGPPVIPECVSFLLPPCIPPAHCVFLIQPTSGSGASKKPWAHCVFLTRPTYGSRARKKPWTGGVYGGGRQLPRSGITARSFVHPYIPFARGGGSCTRGLAVGGGAHVSSGGGSTPPNAAVGECWRSAYVRFVTK